MVRQVGNASDHLYLISAYFHQDKEHLLFFVYSCRLVAVSLAFRRLLSFW